MAESICKNEFLVPEDRSQSGYFMKLFNMVVALAVFNDVKHLVHNGKSNKFESQIEGKSSSVNGFKGNMI